MMPEEQGVWRHRFSRSLRYTPVPTFIHSLEWSGMLDTEHDRKHHRPPEERHTAAGPVKRDARACYQ